MTIVSLLLIISGLLFFAGGSVGILRFPDFYTRLHPAGKLDTMGLLMTLGGMAVYVAGDMTLSALLTALKIMLIVVFIFITSPTATHAIADAGMRCGLWPWTKDREETK
ncbi:MAG: monovalent cation/H(+) antiporter subunit G [Desulfosudaceae bacterium]